MDSRSFIKSVKKSRGNNFKIKIGNEISSFLDSFEILVGTYTLSNSAICVGIDELHIE